LRPWGREPNNELDKPAAKINFANMAASEQRSNPAAGIVCGGGWRHSPATERLKVKAWVALFLAIGFGHVAVAGADSVWVFAVVPATICLIASIFWFLFEHAREFKTTYRYEAKENPYNLYGPQGAGAVNDDRGQHHPK
jgi:hypothetical protein